MYKNWVPTIGGIMGLFGLLPPAMGQANMHAPNWLNLTCFIIGTLGVGLIGLSAKGQSEPATVDPAVIQKAVADHLATMTGTAPGSAAPGQAPVPGPKP